MSATRLSVYTITYACGVAVERFPPWLAALEGRRGTITPRKQGDVRERESEREREGTESDRFDIRLHIRFELELARGVGREAFGSSAVV